MIGNSYFVVTLAQIFLVFSSVIIIRRLGALFHSHKVGEVASTIFLLNPLVLTLSLIILTDILFLFLFLFGFYLAFSSHYSKSKIIFTSIIFALAIYVRPMGVFALPIFVAPFLASKLYKTFPSKLCQFFMPGMMDQSTVAFLAGSFFSG